MTRATLDRYIADVIDFFPKCTLFCGELFNCILILFTYTEAITPVSHEAIITRLCRNCLRNRIWLNNSECNPPIYTTHIRININYNNSIWIR